MAVRGNGTTDRISNTTLSGAATYSYVMWHYNANAPANASSAQPLQFTNASESVSYGISWDHTNASFRGVAQHRPSPGLGSWYAASFGTLNGGQWYCLGATHDGSDLRSYKDGVLQTTTTCGSSTTNSMELGVLGSAAQSAYIDSDVSLMVYWAGTVLSAEEFLAIANGANPLLIRRSSQAAAWCLDGIHSATETDCSGNGVDGTISGTSKVDGPPTSFWTPQMFQGYPEVIVAGSGATVPILAHHYNHNIGSHL